MKFRSRIRTALASTCLIWLSVVPLSSAEEILAGSEPMPRELFAEWSFDGPAWVSLEAALEAAHLPNGDLRPYAELGHGAGSVRRMMRREQRPGTDGCTVRWNQDHDKVFGRETLQAAISESSSILKATVTGITPGLIRSRFGHLYRVQIEEVLKDSTWTRTQPLGEYFISVESGRFQFKGVTLCLVDREYPKELPGVGDQVILLVAAGWADQVFLSTGGSGFIGLASDGRALVPRRFVYAEPDLEATSSDDLSTMVLSLVENSQ